MPRTQGFDRDIVVRAARTLFWSDGYEGASIPDLEHATGLSRSSIYNTFASKRGLFDAAIQSYLDEVVRPRLRPLSATPVDPDAILDYLTGLRTAFQHADSMPASHGCLLINTAGAPIAHDNHIAQIIADYRAELHAAFTRGIAAHLPARAPSDLAHITDAVTGLVIAAFTLARIDPAQAANNLTTAIHLINHGQRENTTL